MKSYALEADLCPGEAEPTVIKVEVAAGVHACPPGGTQGNFYSFKFYGPIEDLARLIRLIQMHECPKIGAQEWASLQGGGSLQVIE